ncbi:MAG: cobyrinate a,c-diamide synthase [Candidatus Omnitrophica bacterium]|nr:cobyrinate a,c-diamide synthase [Candidatus Omnitrophota bacterium]
MNNPKILIAGVYSGVGKTTVSTGLMLALKEAGFIVQAFKAGPDYIDPGYHTKITGRPSSNLDTYLLSRKAILEIFHMRAKDADISIIEGVMGLYDGLGNTETGSTAELAKILKCPVILVVDAKGFSRSAGAIVLGYKEFDRDVNIAAVILNNAGSQTHYENSKKSIEEKTGIPVVGFLSKEPSIGLQERHLGLIPAEEKKLSVPFKKKLLNLMKNVNLEKIVEISRKSEKLEDVPLSLFNSQRPIRVKIAIAKDKAFNFYYPENIDILKNYGAEICYFSPLKSVRLSESIDGIYFGGGFPELFAKELSVNKKMKALLSQKIKRGMPVYAECGGLMYLMEKLVDFEKRKFKMPGVFKGNVKMSNKLNTLGYVEIKTIKDNILSKKGDKNKGHIFHWSYLDNIPENTMFAYKISKSNGKTFFDGLIKNNVLASYTHLHFASNPEFAKNFIKSCENYKKIKKT